MTQAFVNPEALPSFFRDVEIVGSAHLELPKYREFYALADVSTSPQNCQVSSESSPILLASKTVKEVYQSNDFAKIKELEAKAQKDLGAVYTNVATNKEKAWTKVKKDNKEFYMSWSQTGSMWAYTESNSSADGTTYQAVVQIGTYSSSSQIVGIQTYNLTLPTLLVESVIAYILARAVSSIIADGLGFLFTRFAIYLAEAAAEAGLEAFSFTISAATLSSVATCLVFAIVFIGLAYLWNWLNRKYTIRLQIYNWDDTNSWKATGRPYLSNAKIAGDDQKFDFTLPKMVKPGGVVTPPGFDPVETLDSVCYYAVVVWENDNTFLEGCSMAIGMQKEGINEGFMWAFDCPRFSNNQQGADDGLQDPKTYRNKNPWNQKPLGFQIQSTSTKIPVSFALDALSGASDSLYNINIHIGSGTNPPSPPPQTPLVIYIKGIETTDNCPHVFAIGTDNTLYLNWRDSSGGWSGWGANWNNAPKLASIFAIETTDNCPHVFGIGTDNTLYLNWRDSSGGWSGWGANWNNAPKLANIFAIETTDNCPHVFGIGTDNTLYLNWRNSSGQWSGWIANWA